MFPLYGLSESSFGIIAAGGLNLFSYDDIQKYNETDMNIYRYIVSNIVKIPYMTIRELAGEVYTSPANVIKLS